ncbi:uncharacterized protein LOC135686230 isoform X2 [Rhopilema esculentum]|uniref:uncharacterized protein LOC135686230 isoform X2 n=1 Tax=Rhopilema esculentum TaxID=499914 RepID=UPI0031D6D600
MAKRHNLSTCGQIVESCFVYDKKTMVIKNKNNTITGCIDVSISRNCEMYDAHLKSHFRHLQAVCFSKNRLGFSYRFKMKTLVLISLALLLVLSLVDTKLHRSKEIQRNKWSRLRPVGPMRLRKIATRKQPKVKGGYGKLKVDIASKRLTKVPGVSGALPEEVAKKQSKKPQKKSDYYIDPKVLEKLNRVSSIADFVKVFNPKGFSLRKEYINVKKGTKDKSYNLKGVSTGVAGRPGPSSSGETSSSSIEKKEVLVVYEGDQRLADSFQFSDSTDMSCKPRDTVRSISEIGKTHIPACVTVKRCGGCCSVSRHCVADTIANKSVSVLEMSHADYSYRLVSKVFVEHKTCKCDCIVKPTDCYPMQTYSSVHCQCECNRNAQTCPSGKQWSNVECDCICSDRRVCKSRVRKWDKKNCRCACIDTPCPVGTVRNIETCRCDTVAASDGLMDTRKSAFDHQKPLIDDIFRYDEDRSDDSDDDEADDDAFGDF